jgi:hypothetical protein
MRYSLDLKGCDGLGAKFLNGGQNFTINAEKKALNIFVSNGSTS